MSNDQAHNAQPDDDDRHADNGELSLLQYFEGILAILEYGGDLVCDDKFTAKLADACGHKADVGLWSVINQVGEYVKNVLGHEEGRKRQGYNWDNIVRISQSAFDRRPRKLFGNADAFANSRKRARRISPVSQQ